MEVSPMELVEKMELDFLVMQEAVKAGQEENQKSMSGLTGGEGYKMKAYAEKNGGLCGTLLSKAISRALSVAGCNASMGRIVAAPTAGSCGILPGCLVSLWEDRGFDEKDVVMSMFTAGAFGMVIAGRASIAGAQGGCQAECGSAAAMAAAALVELMGGTPRQCADACAIAIANQLGLVCDPVAGLVEIPCIKRNVSGLQNSRRRMLGRHAPGRRRPARFPERNGQRRPGGDPYGTKAAKAGFRRRRESRLKPHSRLRRQLP